MAWIVLILSGVLEAVWATALSASKGFKRIRPALVFVVAFVLSLVGLSWAMLEIPTGTAYAVWTSIGAALTVVWAIVTGKEKASLVKLLLVLGIVACVVGLKVFS
ncbi:DMT family transporter [Ruicaihuangia caeni]|uniref:Multidrug efflux SMR transporter n=1 Tax=Ruicaihuangia caeni TaxID=3042517 RepID=A0AAW6T516_9MICO|nr:multidrug efflux SMR transporter [Klugiella sp. YN-L-19]MDI2098364.1 multidrug efflux SMR transporter [Klugiella sp. YN-L-19]